MEAVVWIGIAVLVVIAALIAVINSAGGRAGGGRARPPADPRPRSRTGTRSAGVRRSPGTHRHRADRSSGDHTSSAWAVDTGAAGSSGDGAGFGGGGYGGDSGGGGGSC